MHFTSSRQYFRVNLPQTAFMKIPMEGVSFEDTAIRFDKRKWDETLVDVAATAMTGGRLLLPSPDRFANRDWSAGKKELNFINKHIKDPNRADYTADELYIYQRFPVNNVPSRSLRVRFTAPALKRMAENATEGRTRLLHHTDSNPVGRTIFGEVVETSIRGIKGQYVRTVEYMLRADPDAEPTVLKVESGILAYDSPGVYLGSAIEYKDIEDERGEFSIIEVDYNPDERMPLEMQEISFVYLGELKGVGSATNHGAGSSDDAAGGNRLSAIAPESEYDKALLSLSARAADDNPAGTPPGKVREKAHSTKNQTKIILWKLR